MKDLAKQWEHIKFSMQAKEITRAVKSIKSSDRRENIAEHMWSVSLIFWTLKENFLEEFPNLDISRVYDLIQVHDLGEIITADISTWIHKDMKNERTAKELDAIKKICKALPSKKSDELLNLYTESEEGKTNESKVLRGIDRLSPVIQRLVTGQGWVNENHTEKDLDGIQLPRLQFSKTLSAIYLLLKEEAKVNGLLRDK